MKYKITDSNHWNFIEAVDDFELVRGETIISFDLLKFQGKEQNSTIDDLVVKINDTVRIQGDEYVVKGITFEQLDEIKIHNIVKLHLIKRYCK